jgi:hypothetical protein
MGEEEEERVYGTNTKKIAMAISGNLLSKSEAN